MPTIGSFLTPLPLVAAWRAYDAKYCVSARRFVPPSFDEVRHILNLAQVMAMRGTLRLITLDGDCTLYSDGKDFSDAKLARFITLLMREGVCVALVTAAGYGYDAPKYERRLSGLLRYFAAHQLEAEVAGRFYVLGGETNYLLACERSESAEPGGAATYHLASREHIWQGIFDPDEAAVTQMLDTAEATLVQAVKELQLRAKIIRKTRSIGLIPGGKAGKEQFPVGAGSSRVPSESLDEVVLRLQDNLHALAAGAVAPAEGGGGDAEPRSKRTRRAEPLPPFCAFNGGSDAWVDVGNKAVGVSGLCRVLRVEATSTVHVGDQFLHTGNDLAARSCCPCIWVTSPRETRQVLKTMLRECLKLPSPALKETSNYAASVVA